MGYLAWIVMGLIAGWLAGLLVRGGGYGLIGDVIIGIVGGLIGGFAASVVLGVDNSANGIDLASVVIAFVASLLLIGMVRALPRRSPV